MVWRYRKVSSISQRCASVRAELVEPPVTDVLRQAQHDRPSVWSLPDESLVTSSEPGMLEPSVPCVKIKIGGIKPKT